jgi:hypothetical protein
MNPDVEKGENGDLDAAEVSALIARLLKAFLADSGAEPADLRGVAARLQALPLYSDMGGCIAIRPTGELIGWAWDSPFEDVWPVEDLRWRAIALAHGANRHRELRALLPRRPSNARDCKECKGTGKAPPSFEDSGWHCFSCTGVGWIV